MTRENITPNKNTRKNFYSNIFTLVLNIIIGILYTPYLVKELGVITYGVIPLSLIINQYINVVTLSLTNSLSRFYSIAVNQNKQIEASQALTSAFFTICLIIIVLVLPLGLSIKNIDSIFTINKQILQQAQILFAFTILSLFLSLISSILNVTLYASNRLDVINLTKNIRNLGKLLLTFLFFTISSSPTLIQVGLAFFITEIIVLIFSFYFYIKYKPQIVRINIKLVNKKILSQILLLSSWTIIQKTGDVFLYRSDNIIINKFWGLEESAALGAMSEFGNYLILVSSVLGSLFGPLILKEYALNNHANIKNMMINQSFIVGSITAIMSGVLAGFALPFLKLWLGTEISSYYMWFQIKLIVIPFMAAGSIMAFVYTVWNKVKKPALYTIAIGCISILTSLAIIFVTPNATLILLNICIWSILQSYILNLICVGKIYKGVSKPILINSIKIIIIFFISVFLSYIYSLYISINNIVVLGTSIIILGLIMFIITYYGLYNKLCKSIILNLLISKE
jgi:membrane protein EpsK